jgi:hypothetical protein
MAAVDTPATAEEARERTRQPGPGNPDRNSLGLVDLDIAAADIAAADIAAADIAAADIGPAAVAGAAAPAEDTVAHSAQDKWEPD